MAEPKHSETELLVDRRGSSSEILWATLNRPESRNAMTFAMYDRLENLCAEVNRDPSVRAIIISGAGGRAFSAGTDISQFRSFKAEADALAYERRIDSVLGALEAVRVPTIAAIAGACMGGGAAIAAVCDLRLATRSLKFGFPIARTLGNTLSMANVARLTMLVGAARVKELVFLARLFGPEEALQIGLVNEVVASEADLESRATELATTVAAHAPLTMETAKEALRRIRLQMTAPDAGDDLIIKAYMSEDFREGIRAFLDKRPPRWKGE